MYAPRKGGLFFIFCEFFLPPHSPRSPFSLIRRKTERGLHEMACARCSAWLPFPRDCHVVNHPKPAFYNLLSSQRWGFNNWKIVKSRTHRLPVHKRSRSGLRDIRKEQSISRLGEATVLIFCRKWVIGKKLPNKNPADGSNTT